MNAAESKPTPVLPLDIDAMFADVQDYRAAYDEAVKSERVMRRSFFVCLGSFGVVLAALIAMVAMSASIEWYAAVLLCNFTSLGAMGWCEAEREKAIRDADAAEA